MSLQKDPRPDDKAVLERTGIVDLTAHLTDFVETAALVSCLDLVITDDTSVAHLAGAQGCPTWILLPYVPDWRWLLDREDSPWYPTVRLFRQTETRDYGEVLDRVRDELLKLSSARRTVLKRNDPGTSGNVPGSSSLTTRAYLLDMSTCFVQLGGLVSAYRVPMCMNIEIDFATRQSH